MKRLLLAVLLAANAAWADIPPQEPATLPDTSCNGKKPGDACNGGGTCRSVRVRRPQLAPGASVPTWAWTQVLVCEKPEEAPSSAPRLALAASVLLLLAALFVTRRSAMSASAGLGMRGG